MKIDLHCHSKWSKRPTLWFMQKLGCPESFTEPEQLYRICRNKGMDWVTITDHNIIDGALEIAHLPNTLIGCEYTTYFPKDRCKVHVLVYGQTEAQHAEITAVRPNIFEFTEYLQSQNLHHVCAHPLFWINDRLTLEHIEQLVLLYKNWEINGDNVTAMNEAVRLIAGGLTQDDIERLSNKHGIEVGFERPWEKNLTAGSDDHGSLRLASAFTEVSGAATLEDFWHGVQHGHARVSVEPTTPKRFARNVYAIAYQFYRSRLGWDQYAGKDMFLKFLDESLEHRADSPTPTPSWYHMRRSKRRCAREQRFSEQTIVQFARIEAERQILNDAKLMNLVLNGRHQTACVDDLWFELVTRVSNKLFSEVGGHAMERLLRGQIFDLFHTAGAGGALYGLLAPYFVGYSLHQKQRAWAEEVARHFNLVLDRQTTTRSQARIAHFTDTFYDVNGVARTLEHHVRLAGELERDYTILLCATDAKPRQRGVRCFRSTGAFPIPDYPEIEVQAPPFLEMLQHCYEQDYTHVHIATPGPVGLTGLAIGRILGLPVTGTYHTAFPEFALHITEDRYVEDLVWKLMVWHYNQLDAVFAPSRATAESLIAKGVRPDLVKTYPRGCDAARFHPSKRSDVFTTRYGVDPRSVRVLYVGRISREKGLDVLASSWQMLGSSISDVELVVVGDGPYREDFERLVHGRNVTFTGYLDGEALYEAYASADFFVLPSTTDTFGNVVLEAQASGLPVIVSDTGGPAENLVDGETGFIFPGGNAPALAEAMRTLAADAGLRERMGCAARRYAEQRDHHSTFSEYCEMIAAQPRAGKGTDMQDAFRRSGLNLSRIAS